MKITPNISNFKYRKTFLYLKKKKKIQNLKFGNFGLKIIKSFILKDIYLKLLIKYLTRKLKKLGKFYFRLFPNFTITKKSLGTRMGGGSGKITNWGVFLQEGKIFLEILSSNNKYIYKILNYCLKKLPKGLKIINNNTFK
jgi:large subunit ribosomal protein L16